MSRLFRARVVENISLTKEISQLTLRPLSETVPPQAGQFYMLQSGNTSDPLLKRPFSIFSKSLDTIQFVFRVRGKGTRFLSAKKQGEVIEAIGPLGNGYPMPQDDFIVVAGGIGIASLFLLIEQAPERAYLFYGARTAEELIFADNLKRLSREIYLTTDDGTLGERGMVLSETQRFLKSHQSAIPFVIYACGPQAMLSALASVAAERELKCFVSLETHMACGIGACLGCAVKMKGQKTGIMPVHKNEGAISQRAAFEELGALNTEYVYRRACKEGPVFEASDVVW